MEKIIIIGNGPAGCTAALYAARSEMAPLLLTGNQPGGLLTQTSEIENFPGFPNGLNGFELMNRMQEQAEKFGAKVEYESVASVALTDGGIQKVTLESGTVLECEALMIATGATPRPLGIAAEETYKARGVSYCATCDGPFYKNKIVAVVGGGDSAMEEATFLTAFAQKVMVIHRRKELRASKIMAERALANPKIEFHWDRVVCDMYGDDKLAGIVVQDVNDHSEEKLPCDACFIALGHTPRTELFEGILEMDPAGFLVPRGRTQESNLKGVFLCGDCADPRYRQAISAAGTGCMAALDAVRYLENKA